MSDAASVQCLRMWSNGKVIMLLFGIMVIAPLLPLLLPLSAALLVAPWRPWGVRWRSLLRRPRRQQRRGPADFVCTEPTDNDEANTPIVVALRRLALTKPLL